MIPNASGGFRELDVVSVGLYGRQLTEASAGTGKTYAIEALYLRLLLERELRPGQILVMTFTEAATADLKHRIREKLRRAVTAFETGWSDDKFIARLLAQPHDRQASRQVLRDALRDFDQSAIHTIHAFCQRALLDHAFESASLFDTELITNQSELLEEIVRDIWRREMYGSTFLFGRYALDRLNVDHLLALAKAVVGRPMLEILPRFSVGREDQVKKVSQLESTATATYEEVCRTWEKHRADILDFISDRKGPNKRKPGRKLAEGWAHKLEAYLASGYALAEAESLGRFCRSSLEGASEAWPVLNHRFFDLCDELVNIRSQLAAAYDDRLTRIRAELKDQAEKDLKERKAARNLRFFDDLLTELDAALQRPAGESLAESIRKRYPAALIDEFQDTDPLQYRIFSRIYPGNPNEALFLIGDPKQAIYSFRNADVFAYLRAAGEVSERYTLLENWRSAPKLIDAVNAIFSRASGMGFNPFLIEGIAYRETRPGDVDIGKEFRWNGNEDPSPFQLWLMRRTEEFQFTVMESNRRYVARAVAGEIARLVRSGRGGAACIEERPLSARDIAVLVRDRYQASAVQQALHEFALPSVAYTQDSVLVSHEAVELARVLTAIADPGNEGKVKAALATDMLGVSGSQLHEEFENESLWDMRLQSFAAYRDLWLEKGFMVMAAALLAREKVRGRLLAAPDGLRRLTNFQHCVELVHRAILEERLGMEGALKWLADARAAGGMTTGEEQQLRLETDDAAVKVLTMHMSKGLQFPVVFCPFNWHVREGKSDLGISYHDPAQGHLLTRDLSMEVPDDITERAGVEQLAEEVRLLYVAVTRAKYRCYLVWGGFKGAQYSSLAHVLHPGRTMYFKARKGDTSAATPDGELLTDLESLARRSRGAIRLVPVTEAGENDDVMAAPSAESTKYECRPFTATIRRDWGITSYSALVSGRYRQPESPDRDETVADLAPGSEAGSAMTDDSIMGFPRGAQAGTALHEILEGADFVDPLGEATRSLVRAKLAQFNIQDRWANAVIQVIRETASLPINDANGHFTLSRLGPQDRIAELEFTLPLEGASRERLRQVFAQRSSQVFPEDLPGLLEKLEFLPERGLLKGFMDAVFRWQGRYFVIDWKSNYLGPRLEDYSPARLREAMAREYYFLQYHLYIAALHRYLGSRLGCDAYRYERHVGGIIYVFLRGVRSEHGENYGIFRDLPKEDLIADLDRCLFQSREAVR